MDSDTSREYGGRITVSVDPADGVGASRGEASWELHKEFEWHLAVWRSHADPMAACFGCRASWRFTGPAALASESPYWLVLSGERRGSDVVY